MGLFTTKSGIEENEEYVFHYPISKRLLLIFTKNPVLGKCKTRLAQAVGDETALKIYEFLLQHTVSIIENISADKWVYYSDEIWENDLWNSEIYHKRIQRGNNLGQRMYHAFEEAFAHGYQKVIIIGCDIYEMQSSDIEAGFEALSSSEFVLGPAADGGYYLLGMTSLKKDIFENKNWGDNSVFSDTLENLKDRKYTLLEERNDVDTFEDIKGHPDFQPFLNSKN